MTGAETKSFFTDINNYHRLAVAAYHADDLKTCRRYILARDVLIQAFSNASNRPVFLCYEGAWAADCVPKRIKEKYKNGPKDERTKEQRFDFLFHADDDDVKKELS